MSFECSFKTDGNPTTLYTVHWYNMDVKIKTATVNGDAEGKVTLSEDDLAKRGYGTTVRIYSTDLISIFEIFVLTYKKDSY